MKLMDARALDTLHVDPLLSNSTCEISLDMLLFIFRIFRPNKYLKYLLSLIFIFEIKFDCLIIISWNSSMIDLLSHYIKASLFCRIN